MESEEIILVELLAPAGSREAFRAAIESGADAVYLAGASFGARAYADNFDAEGLREAIRFAHLRGVHVHVTVNTIVDDQELAKLADYLRFLYEAGADAVLVQDLGVARLAREVVPTLPLHASTQMTVHNLAGVRALEAVGFSRIVLSRELSIKHDVDPTEVVEVGDTVEALVLQKEDKEGRLILSKKRAQYERAWGDVEKIRDEDGVVTGTVIDVVKGGLIVDIGLRGFLPASLIELRRVRDLTPYLGQEIEAKILELDKNRNNVVLSRRALLEQTQSASRGEFLADLAPGQIRKGVISSIVNFGAFVDLGGVDGLVHVSELSWKHIEHASEVVEVGQEVTVEVLSVELDRERVSLSLKATQEDPWQVFARTHAIGQVAPGKVTKLVPFGAFVRVADGIEGLVHISELSGQHVELAEQVVSVGEEVFVKVIDIDLERRRISLSLKQANEGVDPEGTEFDPALYGMLTEYDEQGNYKYPDGFDPETQEWKEGFEAAREKWEQDYAAAQQRWEQHKKQVAASIEKLAHLEPAADSATSSFNTTESASSAGTLADDEALAALKEQLEETN